MKLLRLFSVFALTVILVLSFAACGGSSKPSTTPSVEQSVEQSTLPSTAPSETPEKTTYTITVLYPDGTPAMGVMVQACNDTNCYPFLPNATDANGSATKTLVTDSTLVAKLMGEAPAGYTANAEGYPFVNGVAVITLIAIDVTPSVAPSVEESVEPSAEESIEPSVLPTVEPSTTPSLAPNTVLYKVTVLDSTGAPVAGVMVRFYKSSKQYEPDALTDENGVVTIALEPGKYLPQIDPTTIPEFATLPLDEYLTSTKTELTLQLGSNAPDGTAYNPFPVQTDTEVQVTLTDNALVYYGFTPTVSGVYTFTSTGDADPCIGYYGSAFFVSDQPQEFDDDGGDDHNFSLSLSITDQYIGNTYVMGIRVVGELTEPVTFSFTVKRTGDAFEPAPLPVNTIEATENPKPFPNQAALNMALIPADLDGSMGIVYNETDGYYHVGSETGPLLLAMLTKPILQYFDSAMNTWSGTQGLIFTITYEEYKNDYAPLFDAYAATCNADGVCPVTEELYTFLTAFAKYNRYFTKSGWIGQNLADNGEGVTANEQEGLFACYYYKSSILGGDGTQSSPYQIGLGSFKAQVTDSPLYYEVQFPYDVVISAEGATVTTLAEGGKSFCISANAAGTYTFTVAMKMQGTGAITNPYVIEMLGVAYSAFLAAPQENQASTTLYFTYVAEKSGTLFIDAFYKRAELAVWDYDLNDATLTDTDNGQTLEVVEGKTYYFIFTLRTLSDDDISITLSYVEEDAEDSADAE